MSKATLMARVWADLSNVNVNDHIEKKGQLSYLSWTWAWSKLKSAYPETYISFKNVRHKNDSMTVECFINIHDGEEVCSGYGWLPVMDNRNRAVIDPDARAISDARMRCLVKTIAMTTGLGLYIYAGEDIPQAEKDALNQPIDKAQSQQLNEMIDYSGTDVAKFLGFYKIQSVSELPKSHFEQAYNMLGKKIADMESATAVSDEIIDDDSL